MGLNWQYENVGAAEIAKFKACGISAWVCDCDGDYAKLKVRSGDTVLAEKTIQSTSSDSWPFDEALAEAEILLRHEVKQRKLKYI